ncbi:hypothetical protein [Arthrobacter sp. QXT-31]|uniref:hypothetical protein n=1 Tax=Arthrobacter sp. QXT-31 TaxID=1357915 RepID=UPI000971B55E|nr:hypothetical protein [Arthrobacter sp. QXT-31]APX02694.1 hypothetical protein BWQ92_14120 [Arthrobacter sp. QXT-31]
MNQQSQGQPGPAQAHNAAPNFMKQQGVRNEAVAGPFTVRDLTVFGATLVLFVASLIPMFAVRYNLWNLGSLFFLGLGVVLPLIVAALFVARRLAPETKVRIGSLSVDQFGSVVASFAVGFFFLSVAGAYTPSLLVALIGSLVLLAATVLARYIPFFAGDFLDRAEVPAHIMARDSAVPVRKPKAPKEAKPAAVKPGGAAAGAVPAGPEARGAASPGPVSSGPATSGHVSHGHVSHGATAVSQPGQGTAQAGTAGAVIPGATADIPGAAGAAPGTGVWPAANAASSAAASPETGPAAVVPSAQTRDAAAQPATAAEQTQPNRAPVSPATGAPAAGAEAPAAQAAPETAAAPAPEAAGAAGQGDKAARADTAAREAEAARVASATPATAVHPRVDLQEQQRSQEPIGATVDPSSRPEESEQEQVHEAFWFAVAQHRTAVDERTGAPLFGIEPGGWVLALEDRGDEFLVQHTDGRVGVLRDLSNIERG